MTLLRLLRQARRLYPLLGVCDLLIAGLEELISQNRRSSDKDIYEEWAELSVRKWKEWADFLYYIQNK